MRVSEYMSVRLWVCFTISLFMQFSVLLRTVFFFYISLWPLSFV